MFSRARKVRLLVFDNDLRGTLKKYPVSESGTRIKVKSGGTEHFMPEFGFKNRLEIKKPWYQGGGYLQIYLAKKKAEACIDFTTEQPEIPLPNLEELKDATNNYLGSKLGKDAQKADWQIWAVLFLQFMMIGLLLRIGGMI